MSDLPVAPQAHKEEELDAPVIQLYQLMMRAIESTYSDFTYADKENICHLMVSKEGVVSVGRSKV